MTDVPLGYVTAANAKRITGLSRERIRQLCLAGKVRRILAADSPRWLYNAADLAAHKRTATPGRPWPKPDRE